MASKTIQEVLHRWQPFALGSKACALSAPTDVYGLNGSSVAFFLREVCTKKPCLIVTSGEREASDIALDLRTACPEASINILPWWGTIPYRPAAVSSPVFGERAACLSRLASGDGGIFITTERSFLSVLPPPSSLTSRSVLFEPSMKIDTVQTAKTLSAMGYTRVSRVHVHGEFSLRGEVLDIFLHGDEEPTRIKLDYDEIASIKHFDADTQLSTTPLQKTIVPCSREVFWDEEKVQALRKCPQLTRLAKYDNLSENSLPFTDTVQKKLEEMLDALEINGMAEGEELLYPLLFQSTAADYAGDAMLVLPEADRLFNSEAAIHDENNALYRKARTELPCLPPEDTLLSLSDMVSRFPHRLLFHSLASASPLPPNAVSIPTEPSRSFFGNVLFLKETLSSLRDDGWQVHVFAGGDNQASRISSLLKDEEAKPLAHVIPDAITEGFSVPDAKLLVIQEGEIFARKKRAAPPSRKAKSEAIDTFVELNPGDYVVHVDYGIGIFRSIDRVKALGLERDYIALEYADGDKVFVPTEQVNLVQRYIGSSSSPPRLDRIGTKSWENRKRQAAKAVEEMAQKLLSLYARREAAQGHAFDKDGEWQAAFEAAFPYEDTPDQSSVTEEIKRDMEKPIPMDRLICGDVGYGKTEVAMRAAFKAVMGGAQAAFLAPTTILSEQHYETLLERFKGFPVKIALLSRFVPPAEQKKVLRRLASGDVDILVGTHRIIQSDVRFKALGLLIIDEEQRFGVKDKERLKEMRSNIDCLAMSATPIPRTLHMSLLKIRDMSLLTTPPQNRQPIETTVEPYSSERVASSIRQEVSRGGQVFFLHNRVESLEDTRRSIERLVPECLVECAHGSMSADDLDGIFRRFKAGAFHVLVSTTIIENGIDIPNVNTIIIDRADMYGISQLYQLRGRVGRSDRKAYAYLLYPEKKALSEVAMKRLEAISDFTELGSGFKIAMKDLEIRGAGNLLGRDQSGQICSVGFDMYMRLLSNAVDRLKSAKDYKEEGDVLLEIGYTGFIPDSYIKNSKMQVYKEIARVTTQDELDALQKSLLDRFGEPPQSVISLLSLAQVKIAARALNIRSIKEMQEAGDSPRLKIVIEVRDTSSIKIDRLLSLIKEYPAAISLSPHEPNKIFLTAPELFCNDKLLFLAQVLERLK